MGNTTKGKVDWKTLASCWKVVRQLNAAYVFQNAWLFENKHVLLIFSTCDKSSGDKAPQILHEHDFGDGVETHCSKRANAVDTMSLWQISLVKHACTHLRCTSVNGIPSWKSSGILSWRPSKMLDQSNFEHYIKLISVCMRKMWRKGRRPWL